MTRYAVRHHDGKYLALAHFEDRILHVWTHDRDLRWTWPTMSDAILGVFMADWWDPLMPWDVELVSPAGASERQ